MEQSLTLQQIYKKQYNVKYRKENKEKIKIQTQKWLSNHKTNVQRWNKTYRKKYAKKLKERKSLEYYKHKERYQKRAKINYRKNHAFRLEYSKKWREKNPQYLMEQGRRCLAKQASKIKFTECAYRYALHEWSKLIKKRGNGLCQVCFQPALHSHHIFHRRYYPELSLNINNGIPLCVPHHKEAHMT